MKRFLKPLLFAAPCVIGALILAIQCLGVSLTSAQSSSPQDLAASQQAGERQCAQAPQGTDFTTLSDEKLAWYGLPTHAELVSDPALADALTQVRQRICGTSSSANGLTHSFGASANTTLASRNWAGYVAPGSRGTYRSAAVEFSIPKVSGAGIVAFWTGVGGDPKVTSPPVVVQAGVDVEWSSGKQTNTAWWEVFPGILAQDLPLRINVGDKVYVYVTSNLGGNGHDDFFIENKTTGVYNSHRVSTPGWFSDSATGECIGERITAISKNGNASLAPLTDFKSERLSRCTVNGKKIGSVKHDALTIVNSTGKPLVKVGAIASNKTDFSLSWHSAS